MHFIKTAWCLPVASPPQALNSFVVVVVQSSAQSVGLRLTIKKSYKKNSHLLQSVEDVVGHVVLQHPLGDENL